MRTRTYDPFRQFERMFAAPSATGSPSIPLDVVRHDDRVELFFDLPGVDPSSIDLTVEKRELVLHATREFQTGEDAQVVRAERRHGDFTRKLLLAENLDTEAMTADYDSGVLAVTIPVLAEAKPRKIDIGSGAGELEA